MTGLRFQTKLVLAMMLAILVVCISILLVTERKVRSAYTRHIEEDFTAQLEAIRESRESRSEDYMDLSRKLARHPFIVETLRQIKEDGTMPKDSEHKSDFWNTYLDGLKVNIPANNIKRGSGPNKRSSGGPLRNQGSNSSGRSIDLFAKIGIIGLMDLEGGRHTLTNPLVSGIGKMKNSRSKFRNSKKRLPFVDIILESDKQLTGYQAVEPRPGETIVNEMVATPVLDPISWEPLGFLVRVSPSSKTSAEQLLDRYQAKLQPGQRIVSGVYLSGEFHFPRKEQNTSEEAFSTAITDAMDGVSDDSVSGRSEVR